MNQPQKRRNPFDRIVEQEEEIQPVQATQREIKSQKEQSISELNEAVMAAPEEAAKLLVSYIKD